MGPQPQDSLLVARARAGRAKALFQFMDSHARLGTKGLWGMDMRQIVHGGLRRDCAD